MCVHPYLTSLNSRERQREMIAQADRQRLRRQLSDLARAARRAAGGGRRKRRVWRTGLLPARRRAVR
jgi:hypothetical protein